MNCRTFAKKLYDYQDGTLAAPEKEEFELHRSGCNRCAALMESESRTAQAMRAAVEDACQGLDLGASSVRFNESALHYQSPSSVLGGWRIAAAVAAVLVMVVLLWPAAQRIAPERADLPGKQGVIEEQRGWTEEIQVTYETGLLAETTLVSHESGITSIIEIQVFYEQ